jgi:hypothetical protein
MPHRVHRKDANHEEIVNALRGRGCDVLSVHSGQADGFPDLLVLWCGDVYLLDVKSKKGAWTEAQRRLLARGWPIRDVRCLEDVGRLFPLIPEPEAAP